MERPDREMLSRAAAEVLEKLTLMLCSYEEDEVEAGLMANWVGASVTFEGPLKGSLVLLFTEDVVQEIAANMLGSEMGELTRDQEKDAMGEAANVLCGNLLPLLFGPDALVTIGSPRSWEGKGRARIPESDRVSGAFFETTLSIEDGKCRIFLFIKEGITTQGQGGEPDDSGSHRR